MANESELDLANREFEQIAPGFTDTMSERFRTAFQIVTIAPGLPNIGQRAYTAPGSAPYQTGPSIAATALSPGSAPGGEGGSSTTTFNLISVGGPTIAGPAHPGSEPPVGPEEALRYSCVDTLCLQDPNGLYYGLDECLAAGCSLSGGGGGDTDPPDPPEPPDPPVILQCYDRAVHCTFAAMILDVTSDSPLNPSPNCTLNGSSGTSLPNRTYWKYEWAEVEAIGAERETWCTPLTSGNTARLGDETTETWAINVFEMGVDDAGGDVAPGAATVNRLQIPQYSIVTMHIDPNGRAWFCEKNPIEVVCDSGALTLTLDGGEFNGGV